MIFKKTDQRQFRKGLIGISSFSPRKSKAGTQGRNVETGTAFETMEVLLSWFAFCGLLSYLSSTTQAQLPRGSTPHRGLDLQLAIKNCPADILTGQSNGDNSFTEAPSSQMCQMTARISHHRYVEIDFEILIISFAFILIFKLNKKKYVRPKWANAIKRATQK